MDKVIGSAAGGGRGYRRRVVGRGRRVRAVRIPSVLIAALLDANVADLSVVSNNCGSMTGGWGCCCGPGG